jgi:heme-binding protein
MSSCYYTMTRQTLDEGANMLPSVRPVRRAIKGAIGTGALAGAMLFGAAAIASAQPPPPAPVPPPCTAAELARVMSGVTFDTSNYLTEHPAVNDFFTSLKGQPRDQIGDEVQTYLDANPQVRADLQGIRQPSVAFRDRCGLPPTP